MATEQSSAQVLAKIWERFAKDVERDTGLPLSKSVASSTHLGGDDHLLARWLNPGARKNWRIPLGRVPDVCQELKASPDMTDRLMMAKFGEISQDDAQHPILVAALWAFGHCERQHHGLSTDELRVLAAYRAHAERYPRGLYGSGDELDPLGPVFEGLLRQAQRAHEDDAEGSEDDPSARRELKEKTDKLLQTMKANSVAVAVARQKAARKAEKSVARQVQDYLRGLRSRRP